MNPRAQSLGMESDGRQRFGPDAAQFPDHDALVFPGLELRWSWRELNQRVNQVAAAFARARRSNRGSTSESGR